jgi:hypothetical protein
MKYRSWERKTEILKAKVLRRAPGNGSLRLATGTSGKLTNSALECMYSLGELLTDIESRCRSRKDKCDGKKPACSTCTLNGRACSYDANVKKRGLPEGYVRGLEKLWGLAIRDVDDIEDNMLEALNGGHKRKDNQDWNDETGSESLVKLWRKSQLSQELERLLSSIETIAESSKRKR